MNKIILKKVATTQTGPFGSQLHNKDYVKVGTPIVTVEHLGVFGFTTQNLPFVSDVDAKRLSKYTLQEGDIVFSRVGSIDRNVYVKKEQEGWLFSGRCLRVRCDPRKINCRYLSFYFKLPYFKKMMLNVSVGATMDSLNTDLMDNLQLYVLNRDAQDEIASFLGNLFSKIELNTKIISELESLARLIYNYWFLQFDFPNEEGIPYRSSGGMMIWCEELKRNIPESWDAKPFETYLKFNYAKIDSDWSYINYLDTGNLTENILNECITINLQQDTKPSRAQRKVQKNDILYSTVRPNQRHYGIMKTPLNNMVASTGFSQMTCKFGDKYNEIFYLALTQEGNQEFLQSVAASAKSSYPSITDDDIKRLRIALPKDLTLLEDVSAVFNNIYTLIAEKQNESKEYAALFDFILPLLMNGQATLIEIEKNAQQ